MLDEWNDQWQNDFVRIYQIFQNSTLGTPEILGQLHSNTSHYHIETMWNANHFNSTPTLETGALDFLRDQKEFIQQQLLLNEDNISTRFENSSDQFIPSF